MMKALDLGCGYEKDRQLPGADLCNSNLGWDEVELETGQRFFPHFASTGEPLPVPNGEYDLVWYSFGLYSCDFMSRKAIADEITRITKPRATLVIRDYTQWYIGGDIVNVPYIEWVKNIEEIFPGWHVDSVYVYVNENGQPEDIDSGALGVAAFLTKGWG